MNVLCVTDGSDDGYETVNVLAGAFGRQLLDKIKIVVVTFPERESPLWDKAYDLWLSEDDLHHAMEIVAEQQLDRLTRTFEPHAQSVESDVTAGKPIEEILKSAESIRADLILVGITSGPRAREVRRVCTELIAQSPIPVVIAYGRAKAGDRAEKAVKSA